MPPRTIDNLGVDVSNRYAEDQSLLDKKLIKDASAISRQTQIDVSIPAFPGEFDILFGTQERNISWASFFPPPKFFEQRGWLFSHQIAPSLGSPEKKEAQLEKLKAERLPLIKVDEKEEEKNKQAKKDTGDQEKEEKEKKILITLFTTMNTLERVLIDINARRNQYQKG